MDLIELKTNSRENTGNGPARALRRQGKVPAILYGPGKDTVMLSVNIMDIEKALKTTTAMQALFNLKLQEEKSERTAMIKELQTHPVSGEYLHVDFYEIAMDQKQRVNVPVTTKGQAIGVGNGGILQIVRRELEISCLPMDIPESIEIDITNLDVGDSVHVDEINLAEGIEIPSDVNFTVLTIVSPKMEAAEIAEEEAEEGMEAEEDSEASAGAEDED